MNSTLVIIIALYLAVTNLTARYIDRNHKIGYGRSVLLSLPLSPMIGLVIALNSKRLNRQ